MRTIVLIAWVIMLAMSTAHAEENPIGRTWYYHQHSCTLDNDALDIPLNGLDLNDALQIQKLIPWLKRCSAFYDCVSKREQGKVKHCYYNDKRWKAMFPLS